jgi:hypothetical protein
MPKHIAGIFLFASVIIFLSSCGDNRGTPSYCVTTFIIAAEQHDISKAWNTLSPYAQQYYNQIGERNRKSGKGILEHDISEIKSFRNIKRDYKIEVDTLNPSTIRIKTYGGLVFNIQTTEIDGEYKLSDGIAVRNLINGIAVDLIKKEYYQ